MKKDEIKRKFSEISIWKRGDERAPHKPLLLLISLAKCARNEERLIPFSEVDKELGKLLRDFGPSRKSYHPEYPFWWLKSDGIWELSNAKNVETRKDHTDPKKSELYKHNVKGGLTEAVFETIKQEPLLLQELAKIILESNFPESLHDDILQAVGLSLQNVASGLLSRDPEFRIRILTIYEYRCAICGFDVRLDSAPVCLEAAHIKWHIAGGPSLEHNGLALCSLHHKLFDRGALSIGTDLSVRVSERANGTLGFSEWLMDFKDKKIKPPISEIYFPKKEYIDWHYQEVFQGPAR